VIELPCTRTENRTTTKMIPYIRPESSTPARTASAPRRIGTAPFRRTPDDEELLPATKTHRREQRDECERPQNEGEHEGKDETFSPDGRVVETAVSDREPERGECGDLGQRSE